MRISGKYFLKNKPCIFLTGAGNLSTLADLLKQHLPMYQILWGRKWPETLERASTPPIFTQPVYLLDGLLNERLYRNWQQAGMPGKLGSPLLQTPEDIEEMGNILLALYGSGPMLLVGHGTSHKGGEAYLVLEKYLQKNSHYPVAIAWMEREGERQNILRWIVRFGGQSLWLIPLMLHNGKHVSEEIMGGSAESWLSFLTDLGIEVTSVFHGLLEEKQIQEWIIRKIEKGIQEGME